VQSSSQIITTNKPTPNVLQSGCPSYCPTNSVRALKERKSHSKHLLTPSSTGVFQLCLWPLKAPGYLGEGCLWCQFPAGQDIDRQNCSTGGNADLTYTTKERLHSRTKAFPAWMLVVSPWIVVCTNISCRRQHRCITLMQSSQKFLSSESKMCTFSMPQCSIDQNYVVGSGVKSVEYFGPHFSGQSYVLVKWIYGLWIFVDISILS